MTTIWHAILPYSIVIYKTSFAERIAILVWRDYISLTEYMIIVTIYNWSYLISVFNIQSYLINLLAACRLYQIKINSLN